MYLGVGAMESCWLYPWLALVWGSAGQGARLSLGAVMGTLLLSHYLTRWMDHRRVSLTAQRTISVLLLVVTSLTLVRFFSYPAVQAGELLWLRQLASDLGGIMERVPLSLLTLLAVCYLWWRGIQLGQSDLDMDGAALSFRIGVVAFLWLLLVSVFGAPLDPTPFLVSYFAIGLVVLALARLEDVNESSLSIRSPFGLSWLAILVSVVCLVIATSLLGIRLVTPSNIAGVFGYLKPLWGIMRPLLDPLLQVIEALLSLMLGFLVWLFASALGMSDSEISLPSSPFEEFMAAFRELRPASPPWVLEWLKWGALGAALLVTLAAIALSIHRRERELRVGREGSHETVLAGPLVADEGSSRGRLRELLGALGEWLTSFSGERYAIRTIRQIYASLVRLAAARGFQRNEAETAYEFVVTLRRAFPGCEDEILAITEAYVRAHYGMHPAAGREVELVRAAWLTIRDRQAQNAP